MKALTVIFGYALLCFVLSYLFGVYVSKALQPLLIFPAIFFGLMLGYALGESDD